MSNITGVKPSGLPDPLVPVGLNDSWLVIETSDGKVCKMRPTTFAAVVNQAAFFAEELAFSGTTLVLPVSALTNNGKFPAEDVKIRVYTNGSIDHPITDYTITRNAGATPDEVEFTAARDGDDILILFNL